MELLYGKPIAEKILADTKRRIEEAGIVPGLAVLLIGDDAPSHLYVGLKERAAQSIGMHFEKILLPENTPFQFIFRRIDELNDRKDIHGIIVQLPLPAGLPTDEIIERIDPKKDADGFHPETVRKFLLGEHSSCPVFPRAIVEVLRATKQSFNGEKGLVIANSELLGKAVVQALQCEGLDAKYVLRPKAKEEIAIETRASRVIVTACGVLDSVTGDMISENAIVIDGGISNVDGKVVGDIHQSSVGAVAAFVSPVPGGVGPVTIACLLRRTFSLSQKSLYTGKSE